MQKFIELIKTFEKPTAARIVIETSVKMNKKDVATKTKSNPYEGSVKVSTMLVTLAPEYETAVNDQLSAEGKDADFEAKSRKWGTNIGNGIVQKGDDLYVSFIVQDTESVKYFFDNAPIEKSLLEEFIPKAKPSANQLTETPIIYRTVKLDSILEIEVI